MNKSIPARPALAEPECVEAPPVKALEDADVVLEGPTGVAVADPLVADPVMVPLLGMMVEPPVGKM